MNSTVTREAVQSAVDDYFAGRITVEEAFLRAYGPHPGDAAATGRHLAAANATGKREETRKDRAKTSK